MKRAYLIRFSTVFGDNRCLNNAYQTGDTGSFVEWFASWFADNMIFAVYILIIAAFIGIISPKIAKALRDMSGF